MTDTETLDRLYLEWSQFTLAKTKRDLIAEAALTEIARTRAEHPGNDKDYADFCVTRALEALDALNVGRRMYEKELTISGEDAGVLLSAFDNYYNVDEDGKVKGFNSDAKLQALRDKLFTAHRHEGD